MAYRDVILAETSLVSYWECQETSGTTLNDSKGSNHADIQNSSWVQMGSKGINGGYAVQFDGVNNGHAIVNSGGTPPTAVPTGNSKYSIEMWVWIGNGTWSNGGTRAGLFGYGSYNGSQYNGLRFNDLTNLLNYHWSNDYQASGFAYPGGKWTHIVVTWNQTNVRVYIDGALFGTSGSMSAFNMQNTNLSIWRSASGETGPDGNLCHLALYDDALTLSQVQAHYAEYIPHATTTYADKVLANPRARHYWKLDEAAGVTSFANEIGTQPLTIVSGASITAGVSPSNIDGGAVHYDTAGSALEQVTREGFNKRQGWAVECWIRPESFNTNVRNYVFYNYGAMIGLGFSRDGTGSANLWFTFDGINHYDTGYYLAPDNFWHHVVFNYHQWGMVQVYVDTIKRFESWSYTQNWGGANLAFRLQVGGGTLVATIDEIVYYEEALPESYMSSHYLAGLAQFPPGAARLSNFSPEVIYINPDLGVRISHFTTEAILRELNNNHARITQVMAEAIVRPTNQPAKVTQLVAEIIQASPPPGPTKTRTTVIA